MHDAGIADVRENLQEEIDGPRAKLRVHGLEMCRFLDLDVVFL